MISYWGVDHGSEVSKAAKFKVFGPPGGGRTRMAGQQDTMRSTMGPSFKPPSRKAPKLNKPVRQPGLNNRDAQGRPRMNWGN